MDLTMAEKIAAFCRELQDSAIEGIARANGAGEIFDRVKAAVLAGQGEAATEADLDLLNRTVRESEGIEFYPRRARAYQPLSGASPDSGALWWSCPAGLCAGRGRVRPGEDPPVCATGAALVPRPLTR
ncbi:hypothetical protein [Actinomadura citrea]|uniref:Uncharacterized protein n=1 Tax=Actinomadura citrea TaxID=46158 RepID=A0A7Y9GHL4_9ACTN|nr:hypothetical protein [Actinomadura citrea]NYE15515.1 hypothetical protein [Actinomadura citrea]GGT65346.1 hypothetical protein GCM10010177_22880 [Actinomadura citrea]